MSEQRPYFNKTNKELGELAQQNQRDPEVLENLLRELDHRDSWSAAKLRREIESLILAIGPAAPERSGESQAASQDPQPSTRPPRPTAQQELSMDDNERNGPSINAGNSPNATGGSSPSQPLEGASNRLDETEIATTGIETPAPSHQEKLSPAQRKARQVFTYLRELDQVRTPVQRDIEDAAWRMDLTSLPLNEACATRSDLAKLLQRDSELEDDSDYVLTVRRPPLTPAPTPPAHLINWIVGDWKNPRQDIDTQARQRIEGSSDEESQSVRYVAFDEDPARVTAWARYQAGRNDWRDKEIPVREVADIFDRLFELHSRLDRESERFDLVLADGLLKWRVASGGLRYPLLHQPVDLRFNPVVPQFSLAVSERPAVFHSALFRGVEEASASVTSEIRRRVEDEGISPLQDAEAEDLFRTLVGKLHPHGQFGEDQQHERDSNAPKITRGPVLFLKDRAQGYAAFIERLLEATDDESVKPSTPLLPVLGFHSTQRADQGGARGPDEVLLSKEANEEQIQVAHDLARSSGVIVQGPPGTGKSHTIANLIGDLLAKGKSVLVTSHASKALRVVREKIVEPLQPLSVSVVTDDLASQAELDLSIRRIAERLGESADDLQAQAEALRRRREDLIRAEQDLRADLLAAREAEYRPIVIAGESFEPSAAARIVQDGRGNDDWIPAGVSRGDPLPLSPTEVEELYATNGSLPPEDESKLSLDPPAPEQVLAPDEFDMIAGKAARSAGEQWLRHWVEPPSPAALRTISGLADHLQQLTTSLNGLDHWERRALAAAIQGNEHARLWLEFVDDVDRAIEEINGAEVAVRRFGPKVPADLDAPDLVTITTEIAKHLATGGKLNRLTLLVRPSWRRIVERVRVDGRSPETSEEFEAVAKAVKLRHTRDQIRRRWERLVEGTGAEPAPANRPEIQIGQRADRLRDVLNWPASKLLPAFQAIEAVGFKAPDGSDRVFSEETAALDRQVHQLSEVCLPAVTEYRNHCLRIQFQERLDELKTRLEGQPVDSAGGRLRAAIRDRNTAAYRDHYAELVRLAGLRSKYLRRAELLARLSPAAEPWAFAVQQRRVPHGSPHQPGDPASAWLWRQLEDEIIARTNADIQDLQDRLARTQQDIRDTTALLVENLAWAEQIRRTSGQARQDLLGYQQLLRRIGKGTGKRAPKLRSEAQKKLKSCRAAVPVWIMPLSRVVESFDPSDTRFDVVIIDEASQMDVMGLLAFHIAEKVLVVGDNEQVSPAAVGQKLDIVDQLIAEHLDGIPNAELYDGQMSIYDIARMSFGASRMLKEHFRCVPEIISFSNHLAYHGMVQPLRDSSQAVRKPATIAYRVRNGFEDGHNVNVHEAEETAALIAAAIEQPEYQDATIGVISLLGNQQDSKVDEYLRNCLPADQYAKHHILCGNPAQFQGDERDVMFLNVVKGPRGDGPLHLQAADNKLWKQRFNVAASRARDQLWVVHSIDPATDLQNTDIRSLLLRHVRDPMATERLVEQVTRRADSPFEIEVASDLIAAGYRVFPQFPVGRYRIDLVVQFQDQRVAIECDGDRYHTAEDLRNDLERQAVLERLGWRFVRIRGTSFFRNRAGTMAYVKNQLRRLGVEPSPSEDADTVDGSTTDLQDRVVRRAAQLLREWRGEEVEPVHAASTTHDR
jgi:very-short-patch-repair endonuclease